MFYSIVWYAFLNLDLKFDLDLTTNYVILKQMTAVTGY